MDIGEIAKKVDALEAELVAKCSSIADLEARVSLLETENARLRKAMPDGEAMVHAGQNGPTFDRLEEGLGGNKQKPVAEHVVNDVIEVSDRKEEGVAVEIDNGKSADEGLPAVPTPMKCAVRVVTFSDDEDDTKEAGVGDDDFSSIPRRKKRKSALMISDSESEDENGEGHGSEDVHVVSPKHVSCVAETGIGKEEGDKDDGKTIGEVIRKMREERRSRDDCGLCETKGCSTPATRHSALLVKSQSKRIRSARRVLEFGETKDHEESEEDGPEEDAGAPQFIDDADCSENTSEESEDGSEEDDSTSEFNDDADCSENSSNSAAELEESDSEPNYKEIMDRIRGKKNANNKDWETEKEMLSAFDEHPELTLKAVCVLYRQQTEEEQVEKATIVHNKRGFNQIDAPRGSYIAQFLLDGDASGPLKKTTQDLEKYDRGGLEFCLKMAFRYSGQLFAIYQNKEDPYFP
ncbi:unnamed protein product [Alopecurus aequalis]